MRFLINLIDFARLAFSRYIENPDAPPKPTWNDGTDGSQWRQ